MHAEVEAVPDTVAGGREVTSPVAAASAGPLGRLGAGICLPILAPLLQRRSVALIMGVCGIAQIAFTWMGLSVIGCPMRDVVHVPCPGCGVTRAIQLLLTGRVIESLHLHAFALLFLLAAVLLTLGGALPGRARLAMAQRVAQIERRTLITQILLVAVVLYWAARLIYSTSAFASLMRGV